jgi:DNA gyrase/topoisomerase IV subunit B
MDFEQNSEIFYNPQKFIYGTIIDNNPQYGVTTKKYGVSVRFWPKLSIFSKTIG